MSNTQTKNNPILQELRGINQELRGVNQRLDGVDKKLNSLEKDMKTVKRDVKKLKKDQNIIIDTFDRELIKHARRLDKVETHLNIAPVF